MNLLPMDASPRRAPLFVAQLPTCDKPDERHIQRVLIANRGEIACRIVKTCRMLNLTSIAIYVEEDAQSRHVSEADEAICLGSIVQPKGNPFLNVRYLVDTAISANADAIHPGYGYLSENADFADAVHKAGIVFVGPSPQVISTLGDKRQSKEYLKKHAPSVPLVPGFAGSSQNVDDLETAAEDIGYPVMLKASAGGGGRGMRIVRERSSLRSDLQRAQSEAARSFGSSDCILEKYIESAKHIEVQILGDRYGKVISLGERECSVQRRHQKVIEETPSPFLSAKLRRDICAVAVKLGESIRYEGAGTVEFVVDAIDGSFYFLEVNTRLQVEHPITEEVTGFDIVALQLFIAAGGRLSDIPRICQELQQNGHAIECRLCAEDPSKNFMPESGTIHLWEESKAAHGSRDVRYETAVSTGSTISIYFDSMIAKVVVWAPSRQLAIAKMIKIMAGTACIGLQTNQAFLQSCLIHPAFQSPTYTTSLIADNLDTLLKNPYMTKSLDPTRVLSVVPALMLRELSHDQSSAQPFRHVRKAFRNQIRDAVNVSSTVVQTANTATSPDTVFCIWSSTRATAGERTSTISVYPVADITDPETKKTLDEGSGTEITRRYTIMTETLRQRGLPNSFQHRVELRSIKKVSHIESGNNDLENVWAEVAIDGSVLEAWITFKPRRAGSLGLSRAECQSVMCHFPALGTWISYRCFGLLSYIESLRDESDGMHAGAALSGKTIRAPMPCKVLSVLKEDGAQVKIGEAVLVIESMKMETSVTSTVQGLFRTSIKKGDTVDDGKVLCWFE